MDFRFTDEQQQLRDVLQRFIRKDYGFERRREIVASGEGFSREVWAQLAELGVLGLTIPEAHGGLGGNAFDALVVMEEFGRGLVVEPYVPTVVMGAWLVAQGASEARQQALLPRIAAGKLLLALAHYEPGSRYETNHVAATAKKQGNRYRLSGAKSVVLHGAAADWLLVSARTASKARDEAGISLFLVERKAQGISLRDYRAHDGHRMAELTLKDVEVGDDALLGREGKAHALIEQAIDQGIAALCAEAVGNMAALIETTLQYIKTRKQFGMPIGGFQVLQHRAADMLMHAEQARSMAYLAAAKASVSDAQDRRRALSAAKAIVGQASRYVGQQAVQLHGGIGVTDELAVSHYFKRLTLINASFGDADHHLGRFSDLILRESRAAGIAPRAKRA